MKLMLAVVQAEDARKLEQELTRRNVDFAQLSSEGGFLREKNVTFLLRLPDDDIDETIAVLRSTCSARTRLLAPASLHPHEALLNMPIEVTVGGATVFVMGAEVERLT